MKILQIGCNNGDDDIYKMIVSNNIEFALLIDANPYVLELTREKYKNVSNVQIESFLVSDTSEMKTFFIPHFNSHRFSQHSSISYNHVIKHNHDPANIKRFDISSISINDLLEKYKLFDLDYLYMDCEGEDYNIIKSLDLYKFKIKNIVFEYSHFPNIDTALNDIKNKMNNHNYEILNDDGGNLTYTLK